MFTTVLVNSESSIGEIIPGIGVNEGFCNGFRDVRPIRGSRYTLGSIEMRENLKNFLNSKFTITLCEKNSSLTFTLNNPVFHKILLYKVYLRCNVTVLQ